MTELKQKTRVVQVPRGSGIEGVLLAMRKLLEVHEKVQSLKVDASLLVSCVYFGRDDEPQDIPVDFEGVMPYAIARNGDIRELQEQPVNAAELIAAMFEEASADRYFPVAFIVGADTQLWKWFTRTTGVELRARESFFGLPVLPDRAVDDHVVLLATAYGRTSSVLDTRRSYKITIPQALPTEAP